MPRISEFYGIVIAMYFSDHPTPHFHAAYGEHEAKLAIRPFALLEGSLPTRQLRMVRHWARLHEGELLANWEIARKHGKPSKIEPLP